MIGFYIGDAFQLFAVEGNLACTSFSGYIQLRNTLNL